MGKNNRQRRKSKKKKGRKAKSQFSGFDYKEIELANAIGTVIGTVVFEEAEPPPGLIMEIDEVISEFPKLQPAWEATKGLNNYLFNGDEPAGEYEQLERLKPLFIRAGSEEEFDFILLYSFLGSVDEREETIQKVATFVEKSTLNHTFLQACQLAAEIIFETPTPSKIDSWKYWGEIGPDIKKIALQLKRVHKLKHLKPGIKAVNALEQALLDCKLPPNDLSRQAVSTVLAYIFHTRLTEEERSSPAWDALPTLCQWAGLRKDAGKEQKSGLVSLIDQSSKLRRYLQDIDVREMEFQDRIRYEALLCRVLLGSADTTPTDYRLFANQLERLCQLLTTGVPPHEREGANRCLDAVCHWLCECVCQLKLPRVPPKVARILWHHMPDDYRATILHWLASNASPGQTKPSKEVEFRHVEFDIFYFGFARQTARTEAFVERFFAGLNNEIKKDLIIKACQRTFFTGAPEEAEKHTWKLITSHLLRPEISPMKEVLAGRLCESEFLLFVSLASVTHRRPLQWLSEDQAGTLIRRLPDFAGRVQNHTYVSSLINQLADYLGPQSLRYLREFSAVVQRMPNINGLEVFFDTFFDLFEEEQLVSDQLEPVRQILRCAQKIPQRSLRTRAQRLQRMFNEKAESLKRETLFANQTLLFPEEAELNEP